MRVKAELTLFVEPTPPAQPDHRRRQARYDVLVTRQNLVDAVLQAVRELGKPEGQHVVFDGGGPDWEGAERFTLWGSPRDGR